MIAALLTLPGLDDGTLHVAEVTSDIANVVSLGGVIPHLSPHSAWLLEIDCNIDICQRDRDILKYRFHVRSVIWLRSTLA